MEAVIVHALQGVDFTIKGQYKAIHRQQHLYAIFIFTAYRCIVVNMAVIL